MHEGFEQSELDSASSSSREGESDVDRDGQADSVPSSVTEELYGTISDETVALTAENGERVQRLAMHGISIDMHTLMLRHLIETLFTEEQRVILNASFQQKLSIVIDNAEAQVDRINLERSAQAGSGLIVPRS